MQKSKKFRQFFCPKRAICEQKNYLLAQKAKLSENSSFWPKLICYNGAARSLTKPNENADLTFQKKSVK